jgi:glutathione S-transferase
MKLYGFGPTRSLRALWGLRELGADFEFVTVNLLAYLMDWANEQGLLVDTPELRAYLERMYARPAAPPRIKAAAKAVGMGS